MAPHVEQVGPEARESLLKLWTTVFDLRPSAFESTFDSYEPNERISLVVQDKGEPVACVQVFLAELGWFDGAPARVGAIGNVSTLPAYRSLGFSSMLLKESIVRMREAGCKWSYLFTGVPQHYARFGWANVEQDELIFDVPTVEASPMESNTGNWMHPLYATASRHPLWQHRTELAWKTRLGPSRPWPERLLVGLPGAHYAALSLGEQDFAVLEWCIEPGHEAEAAQFLVETAQKIGKPRLKILKGLLDASNGELESRLSLHEKLRVGRGMVLPLGEGLTHEDIQRLFDAPRAHFSQLDGF